MFSVARTIQELRMLVYNLIAQACVHKALYASPQHCPLAADLAAVIPHLENSQLSQLARIALEPYVLNAPPTTQVYDTVAALLSVFLNNVFRRLCVSSSSSSTQSGGQSGQSQTVPGSEEEAFFRFLYRDCGIPTGYAGLGADAAELARQNISAETMRSLGDTLMSFGAARGFLCKVGRSVRLSSKLSSFS
jgi:hypothetical protein